MKPDRKGWALETGRVVGKEGGGFCGIQGIQLQEHHSALSSLALYARVGSWRWFPAHRLLLLLWCFYVVHVLLLFEEPTSPPLARR